MASNKFDKIVLVTGANQGLGLAVIEVAGKRHPSNTYILCARDVEKGQQAVRQLRDSGVTAVIEVMELDVTNNNHIATAVKHIDAQYGRLDGECAIRVRYTTRIDARLTKGDCSPRR
jgi:NAD(P)-dependent dehydrogenase (short-subunit alcohol dehydrogenase family)